MTREDADQIIDAALAKLDLGEVRPEPEEFFLEPRFNTIPWLPTYARRLADRVWAIELYRGDRVPEATIESMTNMMVIEPSIKPVFFVPEGDTFEHLLPRCRERGIDVIAKQADEYDVLVSAPAGAVVGGPQTVVRIPDWVLDEVLSLENLNATFRSALVTFVKKYRRLLRSAELSDASQEQLLKSTFKSLLRSDSRFSAEYAPLDLLKFFEQTVFNKGRDHYFHTFNNFLLGCIAIDGCYDDFAQLGRTCFRGTHNWSSEYVWLLTVIFHDVGYSVQKSKDVSEVIYGVPTLGDEQMTQQRKQAWDCPPYKVSRVQMISLYEHLSQPQIDQDWSADIFPIAEHDLDKAFEKAFLTQGHGVASAMRMLADFFRKKPTSAQRQFLTRHIFLAGLSIPFHDWPVRKFLRENHISSIRTSRFPFASLLMFVDSIQEDRRGFSQDPDILTRISVREHTVVAEMDLNSLSPEKLREKKREAQDVNSFLDQDLLHFEYPPELLR